MLVDFSVWKIINQCKAKRKQPDSEELFNCGYNTERERIQQYTQKYREMSVAEAFEDAYDIKFSGDIKIADVIPMDLSLGQVIPLKIARITDDAVIFDSGSYKASFSTRNNLSKYPLFKKYLPVDYVPARVIEIKPDNVMVDIFGPMVEQYILPRVKNPWKQCGIENWQAVTVRNLHLVGGGFVGQAVIPNISEWLGQEYTIDAFIPGSQIVQNTTTDFEQFEGQDVEAFILAYSPKPYNQGMSLICSVKNLIKHRGNLRMMQQWKAWCDQSDEWEEITRKCYLGVVTGILNSSQKCGVFVEVPEMEYTGMINIPASKLSQYHPGDEVYVFLRGFDERMYYNPDVGQMQHLKQFDIVDGCIKEVNVKPIFTEEASWELS